jgi:DDE superfamily endonuclease
VGIPKKVVTTSGIKNVKVLCPSYRDHTSLLVFVNADGTTLPPLFVFKGQQLASENILANAPPQSAFTLQESGYFTSEMTVQVMQHFTTHAVSQRPILLLLDGAKIHIELNALKWYSHNFLSFPTSSFSHLLALLFINFSVDMKMYVYYMCV